MIILVENDDDRTALGFIYDWIKEQVEEYGIDFIYTKPIYDAIIVNIDNRN